MRKLQLLHFHDIAGFLMEMYKPFTTGRSFCQESEGRQLVSRLREGVPGSERGARFISKSSPKF